MNKLFGHKLRKLREARGMSLRDVSQRLGFSSSSYVHDVENGLFVPPPDKLNVLARALGVPVALVEDLKMEARIEDLGIREPEFISMFKELPKLSKKDKQAILDAYASVRDDQNRSYHRAGQ